MFQILIFLMKITVVLMIKPMNVLKSGDRFVARCLGIPAYTYEFVGFDLDDQNQTGCRHIVLKNLDLNELTCVEAAWFNQALTGRSIEVIKQ